MKVIIYGSLTFALLILTSGTFFGAESIRKGDDAADPNGLERRSEDPSAGEVLAPQKNICEEVLSSRIWVDSGHPWRPPFGLDRVGAPPVVHVEIVSKTAASREYDVVAYQQGSALERRSLMLEQYPSEHLPEKEPQDASALLGSAQLTLIPDQVALHGLCPTSERIEELARQPVDWPEFEADAAVQPVRRINPIDLGTILVPHDWLLLANRQTAVVSAAVVSRTRDIPRLRLRAWFEGGDAVETGISLAANRRATKELELPVLSDSESTILHVRLTEGNEELWRKEIRTMVVHEPPLWPNFGAVETKLRYDAPISVHNPQTGEALPSIEYSTAWDPQLSDVVVFLPNGSRFVFWRGSSYIPFWAGRHNTGVSYQWAENLSIPVHHPDGSVDLPEPLFDRELRYGRVRVVESTPSRVHVRWTYQLTDVHYNVWGDHAREDFYFYPDGFGIRVVSVVSAPSTPYQLTEFIVLTPQAAFPLEVIPTHLLDVLFLDGEKKGIRFPFPRGKEMHPGRPVELVANPRKKSMVYRVFSHKEDRVPAIYFSPHDPSMPGAYGPFYDRGQMVTPTYWGGHWPLTRGKWTGWTISDGVYSGPAHNSVAGWLDIPKPLSVSEFPRPDALGRPQDTILRRWVALIAKTDVSDDILLDWARSFSDPPALKVTGARIDFPAYSPERRSLRLIAESRSIKVKLEPISRTVNPVFEFADAPRRLVGVTIDGEPLAAADYAWDGTTLWMKASIGNRGAEIGVQFD